MANVGYDYLNRPNGEVYWATKLLSTVQRASGEEHLLN